MGAMMSNPTAIFANYPLAGVSDLRDKIDEPANEAKAQTKVQREAADTLITNAKKRQADELVTAQAVAARDAARQKQKSEQGLFSGRAGTILTGPLGIPGGQGSPTKTLLGS